MMSYELFKEKFIDYLPEKYQSGVLEIRNVNKINRVLDGITVRMKGDSNIAPNMYINNMYEDYQHSGNLDEVLSYAAEQYIKAAEDLEKNAPDLNIAELKDNVVMCLVNTEQNKELLAGIPSKKFQDLSVIYRWNIDKDMLGVYTTIVTNEIMNDAGLTEEELFRYASENTKRINPVRISALQEAILEMVVMKDMSPEIMEELTSITDPRETMWLISNETGINEQFLCFMKANCISWRKK